MDPVDQVLLLDAYLRRQQYMHRSLAVAVINALGESMADDGKPSKSHSKKGGNQPPKPPKGKRKFTQVSREEMQRLLRDN